MENIKSIIDYIAVSIVPIASCVIALFTYINTRKKKEIDKEVDKEVKVNQKNTHGNNYHYEDNRTYVESYNLVALRQKQQALSEIQQNINDTSKFLSKHGTLYLLIIYFTNVIKLAFPLPKLPFITFNVGNEDYLLKFIATILYQAALPTMTNILLLISLICLVLALKNLIATRTPKKIISIVIFGVIAGIYYYGMNIISKISLDTIKLIDQNYQTFTLSNFIHRMLPFIIVILAIVSWVIANNLIKILFETEYTRPNFKLFKFSIPRTVFYCVVIIFPLFLVFTSQYI